VIYRQNLDACQMTIVRVLDDLIGELRLSRPIVDAARSGNDVELLEALNRYDAAVSDLR
jgi:hypothetical protein